jgi:peptidoglycan biosynthesis protein MviN/MurJ (putative lipid II flippase)
VFAPFSLFVAVAAVPFTSLIFKGGHFDAVAVQRTAGLSLRLLYLRASGAAIEALVMQAFFANRRMLAVTLIGILFSSLSILISWVGLQVSGGRELLLLAFIAGGFTLSRAFKCVTLVEMLKKNAPVFPFGQTAAFMFRVGWLLAWPRGELAAAGRGAMIADLHGRMGDLLKLSVAGAAFGLVYLSPPMRCASVKFASCSRWPGAKSANRLERARQGVLNYLSSKPDSPAENCGHNHLRNSTMGMLDQVKQAMQMRKEAKRIQSEIEKITV